MAEKTVRLVFTSDIHGYLLPTSFAVPGDAPMGLAKLMDAYAPDDDTLILDGGDTLQGSPLTNLFQRLAPEEKTQCLSSERFGAHPVAAAMNLAGYQYVTLGNHDFNYGIDALYDYLQNLDALCLCANIHDADNRLPIAPYAVHRLGNGLRVGIVGVCTHYVARWENPETVKQLVIEDAFEAAARVLPEVKAQCDLTVLLYHGGYECDLNTDEPLSKTSENQACRICRELDYDIVLTGHQHMPTEGRLLFGSYTLQPGYRAPHACEITVRLDDRGEKRFDSRFIQPLDNANAVLCDLFAPLAARVEHWLDTPAGRLSQPMLSEDHLISATNGSLLANFVNLVQRWLSGAQISTCALPNDYKGLPERVTIRDVVSTYIYSNTLVVLEMDRATLKAYMERSAQYFDLDEKERIALGDTFMRPKVQHYNYDFFSGVFYTIDIRRPTGDRVISIRIDGHEMDDDETVSVCVNSYRRAGTSSYDMVAKAPLLREVQTDVADAIIEYIASHPEIEADTTRYARILPEA